MDEISKARAVREMFSAIAGRYDFLNHFLSGNVDRYWRYVCLQEIQKRLPPGDPKTLDVGCGTADLSLVFARLGSVVGVDFSGPMLRVGSDKVSRADVRNRIDLLQGDALTLPFRDGRFDVVVSAFVVRNLANLDKGLAEMRRVLRPGGIIGVLDFAMPRVPLLGALYRAYFLKVLPKMGEIISGVRGAYSYLPASVQRFPPPEVLQAQITQAGFGEVEYRLLTGGIAVLLVGKKGSD